MITAIDSNLLFDLLLDDPIFEAQSQETLQRVSQEGALIVCEAVYAELAGFFSRKPDLDGFLQQTGIRLVPSTSESLFKAGHLWKQIGLKRSRAPSSSRRFLADCLIGAHALLQAERLLTRDQGFYRTAFASLRLA